MKTAPRLVASAAVAIAVLGLLFETITHLREQPPPPPPAVRLSLTAPADTELGTGDEPLDAAISPTQRELIFVATQLQRSAANQAPSGATRLWRRRLDASDAEPIAGTDGARLPAWKQTGNVLSFFADSRLKLLNLKTGTVIEVTASPAPAGATWLRDGSLLFVPAPGPVRRLMGGRVTDATRLAAGDTAHVLPLVSAGGEDFTYVAIRRNGQRVARLNTRGEDKDLGTTTAHAALPDPRWLLFVKDTTLLADYRDADGRFTGRDLPLVLDVGTTPRGRGLFVVSAGLLLYARAAERPRRILWLDMSGAQVGAVADAGDYWQVRVSPDDRNLAVTTRDPLLRSLDVMNIPVDEASPTFRLSTSIAMDTDPVWSPDGRRVSFRSTHRGRPEVFVTTAAIRPADDGQSSAVPATTAGEVPTDWRGGEMLIQRQGGAGFDLERVHETTRATRRVADTPFNETDGRWSPDGRWIAYVSDEPGRPDIFIQTERGERQRVSSGGGTHPRWTGDSRALLFLRGSTVMRAELLAGGARFGPPRPLFDAPGIRDFDVARRSNRLVALLPVTADVAAQASVVLNWQSLLRPPAR